MTSVPPTTPVTARRDAATPLRLALVGMGRMGQAIDGLAAAHAAEVVARLDADDVGGAGPTAAQLAGADVAIEFTTPATALTNARAIVAAGVPVVIGTTGWYDALPELETAVAAAEGRALWAPNFALGVHLFLALAERAGALFATAPGVDAHIVETHHAAKQDAPSGTGIALREAAERGLGRAVPVTSVRVGHVPGTHELVLDGPFDQVVLRHEARDRRVFADGALVAARWLAGTAAAGTYTMRDVVARPAAGARTAEDR